MESKNTYGVPLSYIESIVLNVINKEKYLKFFQSQYTLINQVTRLDIYSETRRREVIFARNTIMYIVSENYKLNTTQIGSLYGKDHCTFLHCKKQVIIWLNTDKLYTEFYKEVNEYYLTNGFYKFYVPKHFIKALSIVRKYGSNSVKELVSKFEEFY